MDTEGLYTERPASTGVREETRNIEVPGVLDPDGQPFVVTLRRLPASEAYLHWGDADEAAKADVPATWRRWAALAVVAPRFSFNGSDAGIPWDTLPLAAHAAVGTAIARYSFELPAGARDTEGAFRGGQPAGPSAGGAGDGPGGDGGVAPGDAPAPDTTGAPVAAGGGAGV